MMKVMQGMKMGCNRQATSTGALRHRTRNFNVLKGTSTSIVRFADKAVCGCTMARNSFASDAVNWRVVKLGYAAP
eukprot:5491226-Prorocentrum_lima.AAC.1